MITSQPWEWEAYEIDWTTCLCGAAARTFADADGVRISGFCSPECLECQRRFDSANERLANRMDVQRR